MDHNDGWLCKFSPSLQINTLTICLYFALIMWYVNASISHLGCQLFPWPLWHCCISCTCHLKWHDFWKNTWHNVCLYFLYNLLLKHFSTQQEFRELSNLCSFCVKCCAVWFYLQLNLVEKFGKISNRKSNKNLFGGEPSSSVPTDGRT
jgi:hypothetical protein